MLAQSVRGISSEISIISRLFERLPTILKASSMKASYTLTIDKQLRVDVELSVPYILTISAAAHGKSTATFKILQRLKFHFN